MSWDIPPGVAVLGAASIAGVATLVAARLGTRSTNRSERAAAEARRRLADVEEQKVQLERNAQEMRGYTQLIDRLQAHLESQDQRRADLLREYEQHRARCERERARIEARLAAAEHRAARAVQQVHLLASVVTDEITRTAALDGLDEPLPAPDVDDAPAT